MFPALDVIKALAVGFIVGVPIGPVGLICVRRTLADGRWIGLCAVAGAATVDAFYGLIAGLGLTAVSHLLTAHPLALKCGSGVFLLYFGASMIGAKPAAAASRAAAPSRRGAFFSTFLLMLAQPFVILSFAAVFAAVGLATAHLSRCAAAGLFLAVFLGSGSWWAVYTLAAHWLRRSLQDGGLRAINLAAGGLICAFGAWRLISLVHF